MQTLCIIAPEKTVGLKLNWGIVITRRHAYPQKILKSRAIILDIDSQQRNLIKELGFKELTSTALFLGANMFQVLKHRDNGVHD